MNQLKCPSCQHIARPFRTASAIWNLWLHLQQAHQLKPRAAAESVRELLLVKKCSDAAISRLMKRIHNHLEQLQTRAARGVPARSS